MLGEWDVASEEIPLKESLPTWHRGFRLFALRTLRRDGTGRWSEEHETLRAGGHTVAADLYLDEPLFASDSEAQIERMWTTLIAENGTLLRRMLTRFAHIANITDPRAALLTMGAEPEKEIYMAAAWRVPIWVLWPPVLSVLGRHVNDAVNAAPLQVATIADRWLRLAPGGYVGRGDAARLGYAIGTFLAAARDRAIYFDEDDDLKLWRAFLAAGGETPARAR